MRVSLVPLCLLTAIGCHRGPDPASVCSVDANVAAGVTAATLNEVPWTSGVGTTWLRAGDAIQFNAPATDGWMLTLVAQSDSDGNAVATSVDDGAFPIHVDLTAGGEGGFATLYPDVGDSFSTSNGGTGVLELLRDEQGVLVGCFDFTAATDGGDQVVADLGTIKAKATQ